MAPSDEVDGTPSIARPINIDDPIQFSLGRALGFKEFCFRRILLLVVCIGAVVQYGMVLVNGVIAADLNAFYDLTDEQGMFLWTMLNFGACALSFIPGIILDRCGPLYAMIIGMLIFNIGIGLQLVWGSSMPSWLATIDGLSFCYVCFGFASVFFNVIGSFVPLLAFEEKHIGKVSACVQVSMSLGMTIQSQVIYSIEQTSGPTVLQYLVYAMVFTNVCGILMCIVFKASHKLLQPADPSPQDALTSSMPTIPQASLIQNMATANFMYMLILFNVAIGFSFSFLDCEAQMAREAGVDPSSLTAIFGIFNALGRLSSSVPLDYTRHHPLGGPFTYVLGSLMFFTSGILLFGWPVEDSQVESEIVHIANVLVAYGYGGLLGIVPPTLKIFFGSTHLGVIYGILYFGVSIAEPLWTMLFVKPADCKGVSCYGTYTFSCGFGLSLTMILTAVMLGKSVKRTRRAQTCSTFLG